MNKKQIFILLLSILLILPIGLSAQNQMVKLSGKNISLNTAFDQIEKQTGLSVDYDSKVIDVKKTISIPTKELALKDLMAILLKDSKCTYTINKSHIIINNSIDAPKGDNPGNKNTSKKVTGLVTDEKGEPIIGATVVLKGSNTGTITNINGEFSLEVPDLSELIVSYVGYKQSTLKIGKSIIYKISLVEDSKALDELVVVGYGTNLKKNVTTSIVSVKTDNISKSANSNATQLLMGRAAGLNATIASSQPGGNVNISIRGSGAPLYIVDGVMMPNDALELSAGKIGVPNSVNRAGLAGLNPNDIESIEVLKDAAASIYGIGAANGVILITTKQGKKGKPQITYDGSYSIVKNYQYLDLLDGKQNMELANIYNKENYLYSKNQYPYGDAPYDNGWSPLYTQDQIDHAQTTRWTDYILKTGSINNQNFTVNGGTETVKYYLGANYYKFDGTVSNSGMERLSLRSNISTQLLAFLKLTAILNINQNKYLNSSVGADTGNQGSHGSGALQSALHYPAFMPLFDSNGKYSIFQNFPNPMAMSEINDKSTTNGFNTTFTVDIDIIKKMLSFKLLYGLNKENSDRSAYIPSDLYFGQMYKSRGSLSFGKRQNETMEGTLTFNKQFSSVLLLDAVIGMGRYVESYTGMSISYENTNDKINNDNIAAAGGPYYPGSYRGINEKRSQFGRISFDMLDKYIISGTLRRDGTDKFFPGNKYSYFPAVSLGWKITNEPFLKKQSWINMLKLRASYGETGRDNLGANMYGVFYPADNLIKFSQNSVTYIPYLMIGADYPDVSWEKTVMKNIGLDFSILKNKISGSFDVFRNDVTDLLGQAPTAPLSMLGTRPINGGHYLRQGWDASINTVNIQNTNFKWTSTLTLSKYNMIWIERMPNYDYAVYQQKEKEPVNAFYHYKITGIINIDRSNMPMSQKSLPVDAQKPGYPIIEDKNNDGVIDVKDIYMYNAVPDIYLGFGNTFTYRNFDLDIFMYGQFGLKKYNYAYSWATAGSLSSIDPGNSNQFAYTMWNSETNLNGTRPGIAGIKAVSLPGSAPTNLDIYDASFLRVRNIVLGYNINGKFLGEIGKYINNIRLFTDIQNPFIFTKFKGFDPEIISGGLSSSNPAEYPQTRTYSLGMKVTL